MTSRLRTDPQVRALIGTALAGLDRPRSAPPPRSRPRRARTWVVELVLAGALTFTGMTSGAANEMIIDDERPFFVPTVRRSLDAAGWKHASRQMARARRDAARAALACAGPSGDGALVAPRLPGVLGGSAGLALALTMVDDLVNAGRTIAVTGTIDASGAVGRIEALEAKVAAAERAGAELFLVPAEQAREAAALATNVTVVGVRTLDDAVRALGGPGCRH